MKKIFLLTLLTFISILTFANTEDYTRLDTIYNGYTEYTIGGDSIIEGYNIYEVPCDFDIKTYYNGKMPRNIILAYDTYTYFVETIYKIRPIRSAIEYVDPTISIKKYITNGILIIEKDGVIYDVKGNRL